MIQKIKAEIGQTIPRCTIAGVEPYVEYTAGRSVAPNNRRSGLRKKI